MVMTQQMVMQMMLQNPELLASALAAKGVPPPTQLAQAGPVAPPVTPSPGMATPPVAAPLAGPTTGPAATTLPGGAPPGALTPPQINSLGTPPAQPQVALGDILSGIRPPGVTTAPRPGGGGVGGSSMGAGNIMELLKYLSQGGGGGQVPQSLGQLLGR